MRNAKYILVVLVAVLAGCAASQKGEATADGISFEYDPAYRTRTVMQNMATDHCRDFKKTAIMVEDIDKGDGTQKRMVTFNCIKQ